MVCAKLREISRSFLRESSRLRIFIRGVNAKKEIFSWADLYVSQAISEVIEMGFCCHITLAVSLRKMPMASIIVSRTWQLRYFFNSISRPGPDQQLRVLIYLKVFLLLLLLC